MKNKYRVVFTEGHEDTIEADGIMIQDGCAVFYCGDWVHGTGANHYAVDVVAILVPSAFKLIHSLPTNVV